MTAAPEIIPFFDEPTNTASYLVVDAGTKAAAIIDPVLDFDIASGCVSTASADEILARAGAEGLNIQWVLETHVHADHLSAANYIRERTGCQIGIGTKVRTVQDAFAPQFGDTGGDEFDRLFEDGETIALGDLTVEVIATPGHTPACVSYRIGDAAFVGDTLFMPDYGTARTDFPGGDARELYRSIQRLFSLPANTRLFLCHDYKAPGRDEFVWQSTVAEERERNVHIGGGKSEDAFVELRQARDATLCAPKLLYPSIQVNIRAGRLPPADDNGVRFLKLPLSGQDL
ncbi:MAG TPA: MBL fold metallo-hydrolase [Sphingomicrobium sp.]|jgi:glyoxylase-like metal-dependent hydrolase (beta-lactamase superfamily II)|nr:MBL fold metallo-hydrolase [Sphingomicrobium sp.]